MSAVPRVTVLMASYNAGRFLDAAIRSVVEQTFRDWEFLIVDDASGDGSREMAAQWAERDARIRLITNLKNKGQTLCLNQGLREARGEWVARQDADDLSHPLRLARQFEWVTCHPETALLGTAGRMIDATDRLRGLLDVPATHRAIQKAALFLNPFLHTSVFFRTRIIRDEFGGYDPAYRISQDYDLWARVIARHPAANLQNRLVCYRHLDQSLSKAGCSRAYLEAAQIADRLGHHRLDAGKLRSLCALREGRPTSGTALARSLSVLGRDLTGGDRLAWRRYSAALLLRAAGAWGSERPRTALSALGLLGTLGQAFFQQPALVASWLAERFLKSG